MNFAVADASPESTAGPSPRAYGRWKAPAADGELLIWPAPDELLRDTLANSQLLRSCNGVMVQNVPLPALRRRMRQFLGVPDDALPLLLTGHQTELHHPGVWIKNALIDAAATRLDGQALHIAVDTDAPKHLSLRWPTDLKDASVRTVSFPLTDDLPRPTDAWSGRLDPPTPAHLGYLAKLLNEAAKEWDFVPMLGEFLLALRRLAAESESLPSALTNVLHEMDWKLGLRHGAMLASPLCVSEPYLAFVHHVMARADHFAADYNSALDEFRRRQGIRSAGRPMPNLRSEPDLCEVPFWLDDLSSGSRSRAHVARGKDGGPWQLQSSDPGHSALFAFNSSAGAWDAAAALLAWLRQHNLRLSPRALTLTSFLRLFAADQFAHGIGGGQYDQVADALVARHFRLTPPRFCVTTATLYFPGAAAVERACVPCVQQEGHRLRHAILGEQKMLLVHAIAAAPRLSSERSRLFHRLHRRLDEATVLPEWMRWRQKRADIERQEQQQRVLFDRELFYCLQPADRLAAMIDKCRAAFQ